MTTHVKVDEVYIVQLNGTPVSCFSNYLDARVKECELHSHHAGEARVEIIRLPVVRKAASPFPTASGFPDE